MEKESHFRDFKGEQSILEQYVALGRILKKGKKFFAFLSIDVAGSTELKKDENEFYVKNAFNKYNEFLGEILRRHSVWKVNVGGDGAMAAFPSADGAVLAAQEILFGLSWFNSQRHLKRDFQLRCGVHCGEVAINEEDVSLEKFPIR